MIKKIRESPINYFSDLFIVAMVSLWILDTLYQSIIATTVTVSSIILSFKTQMIQIDTSMWSSIGSNIVLPLSAGGAVWMIKNSVQHALANKQGKECPQDFPAVNADGQNDGNEEPVNNNSNPENSGESEGVG